MVMTTFNSKCLRTTTCSRRHFPTTGLCSKARGQVACQVVQQPVANVTGQVDQAWCQFVHKFTGEWEGVSATFEPNGKVVPLDSHYVPGAYREWGVELHDWQTTCSTLAQNEAPQQIQLTCRRMMPTVGCEADAIAFTTETAARDSAQQTLLAFSPDGSYISGPQQLQAEHDRATIECGLMLNIPTAAAAAGTDNSSSDGSSSSDSATYRVRVLHHLQRYWQNKEWQLYKVDVHHERWDSPYRGKVELCGCGGGMVPFGNTAAVDTQQVPPSQLPSTWSEAHAFVPEVGSPGRMQSVQPTSLDAVLGPVGPDMHEATTCVLPLGVHYHMGISGKEADIMLDVGVQLREGAEQPAAGSPQRVAQLVFKHGKLLSAAIGVRDDSCK